MTSHTVVFDVIADANSNESASFSGRSPAGTLADIIDRRRLLLQQSLDALVLLAWVLTLIGATTPVVLLSLTFALGLGAAMNATAWQNFARTRLALNYQQRKDSVGFNVARAFHRRGCGTSGGVLLNAASFVGVKFCSLPLAQTTPDWAAEPLIGAIKRDAIHTMRQRWMQY